MEEQNAIAIADEITILLMSNGGSEYIGEPVTKYEHMIQSAMIAEEMGLSGELIIAALLHDIGHILDETTEDNSMSGYGIQDHENIGANFLKERGFSECIQQCVRYHVEAKRYLCFSEEGYYDHLSEASRKTLDFQGGIMSKEEIIAFESIPFFNEVIKIRKIDDMAKKENISYASLRRYRNKIIFHLMNEKSKNYVNL